MVRSGHGSLHLKCNSRLRRCLIHKLTFKSAFLRVRNERFRSFLVRMQVYRRFLAGGWEEESDRFGRAATEDIWLRKFGSGASTLEWAKSVKSAG